jgi:hypothetical protein
MCLTYKHGYLATWYRREVVFSLMVTWLTELGLTCHHPALSGLDSLSLGQEKIHNQNKVQSN